MRYLRSYRYVPRVSLLAWLQALIVLCTYMAANVHGAPFGAEPLAFAVALSVALSLVRNGILRVRWRVALTDRRKRLDLLAAAWAGIGFVALLLHQSGMAAVQLWALWYLGIATLTVAVAVLRPDGVTQLSSYWATGKPDAPLAMVYVAMGMAVSAATAFWLADLGDPALAVAFVAVGARLVGFLTNWVIFLMLFERWRARQS